MRVLFVIDSLGASGAEHSTSTLLPLLCAHGHEVHVATLYDAGFGDEERIRADGFDVQPLRAGTYVGRVRELRRRIAELRPDIVHTALFDSDLVGRVAAWRTGAVVVSSLVNTPYDTRRLDTLGRQRWKVRAVQAADLVTARLFVDHLHAVSPGVATANERALRLPSHKVSVVERGRDPQVLGTWSRARRDGVHARLDVSLDATVVLAIGRQEHQKNHVDLVRAADRLLADVPSLVVLVAGRSGNATPALHACLDAHPGAAAVTRLLGHRLDVPDLLCAADVLAVPSIYEGTAGAAIEAMALRCPVVCAAVPGVAGILEDGRNAVLVEPGDSEALADGLRRRARRARPRRGAARRGPAGVRRALHRRGGRHAHGAVLRRAAGGAAVSASSVVVDALGWRPVAATAATLSRGRLRILAYHDVSDAPRFAAQLDLLADGYRTVTGPVVADWLEGRGSLPDRPVWITFDDGDPTVLDTAAPMLAERDMTATAFICAGMVGTHAAHWWHVVAQAGAHGLLRADDPGGADPAAMTRQLKRVDDAERRRTVDELAARLRDAGLTTDRRQWTADDVDAWVGAGHEVGNHSWDHPLLPRCSADDQRRQLVRAHERLTELLGRPPISFAWPNGDPAGPALDEARKLGYRIVLTCDHRLCRRRPQADALSRLRLDADADVGRARAIVSGAHSAVFHGGRTVAAIKERFRGR